MEQDKNSKQNSANDPAESTREQDHNQQGAREGDYRNVETSVGKASDFGDDYEVEQEDEISEEEARTEKEGRDGKR